MKNKSKNMLYIKLKSLDDLCRYVCNFDYTNSSLMLTKEGSQQRLFAVGETVGDSTIAYYVNVTKPEQVISYTYPSYDNQSENSHFLEAPAHQQSHYMNIINIRRSGFKQSKLNAPKDLITIELEDSSDLIKAIIKRGVSSESIPQIYAFEYGKKTIMCGFDVIEELSDDVKILYYAVSSSTKRENFARYKYSENKVDFTDFLGEHSYMYAKIINLAEPYPFFKMPN